MPLDSSVAILAFSELTHEFFLLFDDRLVFHEMLNVLTRHLICVEEEHEQLVIIEQASDIFDSLNRHWL